MSELTTAQSTAGMLLAQRAMLADAAGDLVGALEIAQAGLIDFPGLLTSKKDSNGTVLQTIAVFETLVRKLNVKLAAQAETVGDAAEEAQPVAETVAAVIAEAPAVQVAPGVHVIDVTAAIRDKAESIGSSVPTVVPAGTLAQLREVTADGSLQREWFEGPALNGPSRGKLVVRHTKDGTHIEGTSTGDNHRAVMGSQGQRWNYSQGMKRSYLNSSKGYFADVQRICWAALALRMAGWDVEIAIDNTGCVAKKLSANTRSTRLSRLFECKRKALAQQRVEEGADSEDDDDSVEPVSAVPVSAVPVSAVPVSAAPVSAVPVSAPAVVQVPDPVAATFDYANLDDMVLLARAMDGDMVAAMRVQERMAGAAASVAPVSAVPVSVAPVSPAPTAPKLVETPVSAVPASVTPVEPPAPVVAAAVAPTPEVVTVDYANMPHEDLVGRSVSGDVEAAMQLLQRLNSAAVPQKPVDPYLEMSDDELLGLVYEADEHAKEVLRDRLSGKAKPKPKASRPVSAPPARPNTRPAAQPAARRSAPVAALPNAPVPVAVLGENGNHHVYYAIKEGARPRSTRTALNKALNFWLNRVGEKGDRPKTEVRTLREARAFVIEIEYIPASADLDAVLTAIGVAAQRAKDDGVGVNLDEAPDADMDDDLESALFGA